MLNTFLSLQSLPFPAAWLGGGAVLLIVVTTTQLWLRAYLKPSRRRHRRYIKQAAKELNVIKTLYQQGNIKGIFYHLRYKVNPYVFEEMVLTAIKDNRVKIIRNKSYSGDGGIDGQFIYQGERWLIQAKKYSHHINPQHVRLHEQLCLYRRNKGLFIHTGKTGRQARSRQVEIISGSNMVKLLAGQQSLSSLLNGKGVVGR